MFRWQKYYLVLAFFGLLTSISAFATVYALYMIPSDPRNIIFLGLSLQRLVMLGGVFFVGVLLAVFAIKAYRNHTRSNGTWLLLFGREVFARGIRWTSAIMVILGLIASLLPLYRFGDFQDYFIRISPIVVWLTLFSFLMFVIAWIEKYGFHLSYFLDTIYMYKKTLAIALVSMVIFSVTWLFIAKTGVGLSINDGYWYGAGVPILGLQIVFALAIGLAVLFLERSSVNSYLPKWSDLLFFFLVWGIAAFLWAREPLHSSFFAPGPFPPDGEYHPYSDAATFDIGSQFALIGQGIYNGVFFDRALYMAFLVFLHSLAGQDYVQLVAIQAAIYAVFPAILYLLGKAIHSRSFGAIFAVLATLRGINGIAAGSIINLANQKQLLTDFPTVIFVAWFALMMVIWLKSPAKNYLYALGAGGVVGLAIMVRTNALFLMLFAVLIIGIVYWRRKLQGALVGLLVVTTMFASTFAWGYHNDKTIFEIYIYRILVVIEARYPQPATPVPVPQGNNAPKFNIESPSQGVIPPTSTVPYNGSNITAPIKLASVAQPLANAGRENDEKKPIPVFVTIHFLHNLITSTFILPMTFEFHDLRHTLKDGGPFWESYWDGSLPSGAGFFLILNLLLISLGIGVSWRSARLAGLVPLGVYLFYNFANAFARTSGGRYLVPIDWVVFFYFALGLFQVILWGMTLFGFKDDNNKENILSKPKVVDWTWEPLKKAPLIIFAFLFIGASLPFSEQFFPKRYPVRTQAEQITFLEKKGYLREMGFDRTALMALTDQSPSFRVINGRALYPRYFWENEGIPKNHYPYNMLGFPRIAFMMIGPNGENSVILPQAEEPYFPNAADVIVLGCQEGAHIDALAVVVVKDQTVIYVRQPASPLQCPLPQPVCNENHICR